MVYGHCYPTRWTSLQVQDASLHSTRRRNRRSHRTGQNRQSVTTFGDLVRVPGPIHVQKTKAEGADVRIVYSLRDAIQMAKKTPEKEFVFFAVGFETTSPTTAVEVLSNLPDNFSFLVSHRLIPPAMEILLGFEDLQIDGFIAAGHVCTITGLKPYEIFPQKYGMPVVVSGFEPLDILFSVDMLLRQLKDGKAKLENEYSRAVTYEGNRKAQQVVNEVFNVVDGNWRGLGTMPKSALALKQKYSSFDAR